MSTLGRGLGSLIPSRSKPSNPNRDFFSAQAFSTDEEITDDKKRDVYFFVGNMQRFRDIFMVLGVFYPPR